MTEAYQKLRGMTTCDKKTWEEEVDIILVKSTMTVKNKCAIVQRKINNVVV